MGVHQFHSGSAYGDAITNSMLLTRNELVRLGLDSRIYVEHVAPELQGDLVPMDKLAELTRDDLLIVRHSMGHDRLDYVLALPCRKVLHYHNITPASFFPEGSVFHRYSILGRAQIEQFLGRVVAAFADSPYNALELVEYGFRDVSVLNTLIDSEKYRNALRPRCLETGTGRPWTVLFVGRVCQNKGHQDLIAAADVMKRRTPFPCQFVCVGAIDYGDPFVRDLMAEVTRCGLEREFRFVGKQSDAELLDWFGRADCYLSLSRHEGFGVPLVEAMLCDVPVVALGAAAVPSTLGGAGLMILDALPTTVAGALTAIATDREFRNRLVAGQRLRAREFSPDAMRQALGKALASVGIETPTGISQSADTFAPEFVGQTVWRFEGPFETSYSLALVNRELGRAIAQLPVNRVGFFATEGPGDYVPAEAAVNSLDPLVRAGHLFAEDPDVPDVVVRNLYPPRVRDARGRANIGYFFWEESPLPREYVNDFNLSLDAIFAPSTYVAKTLRHSGVSRPIFLVGAGCDHLLDVPPVPVEQMPTESTRFLHISSCFPRKGPDVLLRAWYLAFRGRRDVVLLIKTFPNPHHDLGADIATWRANHADFPAVHLIQEELSPGQLRYLYEQCHVYVAPSRGEGFGLPMAEAMLFKLPVLTTAWGAQLDFCTPETAWLVDATPTRANSHVSGHVESIWGEPSAEHLASLLVEIASGRDASAEARVERAYNLVRERFSWRAAAERSLDALKQYRRFVRVAEHRPLRMGWVSTWNERCGIAEYSKFLTENLPHYGVELHVFGKHGTSRAGGSFAFLPAWHHYGIPNLDELLAEIVRARIDCVVIQFNFGFLNVQGLARLVEQLDELNIASVIVFHATKDIDRPDLKISLREGKNGLSKASALLVHTTKDLQRLCEMGIGENASLFPHGVLNLPIEPMEVSRQRLGIPKHVKVVATYGFMLPQKGLCEVAAAFSSLAQEQSDIYLLMVNSLFDSPASHETLAKLNEIVNAPHLAGRVLLMTEFLPIETCVRLLQTADVVVFAYQDTGESASGAVRFGLASQRPVACTNLPIFEEISDITLKFRGFDADSIAADLKEWLYSEKPLAARQAQWLHAHSWAATTERLFGLCKGVVTDMKLRSIQRLDASGRPAQA